MYPNSTKYGAVISALALLCLVPTACGGGDPASAAVPTAPDVKRCVIEAGGRVWGQIPTKPKGFPRPDETVKTIGPELGHITVYLSHRPVYTKQVAEEVHQFGEYDAFPVLDARGLLLLDNDTSAKDRDLAYECIGD